MKHLEVSMNIFWERLHTPFFCFSFLEPSENSGKWHWSYPKYRCQNAVLVRFEENTQVEMTKYTTNQGWLEEMQWPCGLGLHRTLLSGLKPLEARRMDMAQAIHQQSLLYLSLLGGGVHLGCWKAKTCLDTEDSSLPGV